MTILRTERLRLRPAAAADAEALHAIFRDPAAMAYWSTPPHETLDQTRAWLQAMIDIPPAEGEDFIVELEGRVVGKAGLYRFPNIGYIFHPDVWGRGVAREALGAVIPRAFAVHQVARIVADVDPRNDRSLGLLARFGFREAGRAERTYRVGGQWCDSVYLELTEARLNARR